MSDKPHSAWVRYEDGVFKPLGKVNGFDDGGTYRVRIDSKRAWPLHQAFMATVREAWESLPDADRARYSNPDHFRKRMLMKAGYSFTVSLVCKDDAEAWRAAPGLGIVAGEYSVVSVEGNVVAAMVAKSQALDAVGKPWGMKNEQEFNQSCKDVENIIGVMYGITSESMAEWRKARSLE